MTEGPVSGPQPRARRFPISHLLRIALFCAAIALIHCQHRKLTTRRQTTALESVPMARLQVFFPEARRIGDVTPEEGRQVLAEDGRLLGQILQTAPQSDRYVGFSGTTNLLVALSPEQQVIGMEILRSGDTRDHVEVIVRNSAFWERMTGKTAAELGAHERVDGVSGATLTSVAILKGIEARFGGKAVAGKFPEPPPLESARLLFPESTAVEPIDAKSFWQVRAGERTLGQIVRTSPAADDIVGYQGPTEALIAVDADGKITGVVLGKSYDNEEYVAYVRGDAYFREFFNGQALPQLATKTFETSGFEGVSGATMTSVAVTKGLIAAAKQATAAPPAPRAASGTSLPWRLIGTASLIAAALAIGLTRLRGIHSLRLALQVAVVIYLGFLNGELLSQAMLVGWAQSGVPFQGAMGLVFLTSAAFLTPVVTRRNVYCNHLCPHGALQEWLRPPRGRTWHLSPRFATALKAIRPLLLAWIVVVAFCEWPYSLVDIEPFDAYLWRTAGWATIGVAIAGLVASAFVPMAYCRFGCPTGALLDYVRRQGTGTEWTRRDWFAVALVAAGAILTFGT